MPNKLSAPVLSGCCFQTHLSSQKHVLGYLPIAWNLLRQNVPNELNAQVIPIIASKHIEVHKNIT